MILVDTSVWIDFLNGADTRERHALHRLIEEEEDVSIAELALLVADVVGYHGRIEFDPSKPDGTPRKLLDVSRLAGLGWAPRIPLRAGIEDTVRWYQARTTSTP